MDRLNLLLAFVRAVETGNLTAVARELETTQPTVSKRLSALESMVGARLLQRNTQGVRVTEAGEQYYEVARRVLAELDQVHARLAGERRELTGRLRLNLPVGMGEQYLARFAFEFQRMHPRVTLDITLTDRLVDLVEDGVDVAVRAGGVHDPAVVARPLGMLGYVLCASREYARTHGVPKRVGELSSHNFLRYGGGPHEQLMTPEGPVSVPVRSNLTVNNSLVLKRAIVEGLGVGRCARWLVEDELQAGTVTVVLPGVAPAPLPFHALYLASRYVPEKVRAFVAFLTERVKQIPGWCPSR